MVDDKLWCYHLISKYGNRALYYIFEALNGTHQGEPIGYPSENLEEALEYFCFHKIICCRNIREHYYANYSRGWNELLRYLVELGELPKSYSK